MRFIIAMFLLFSVPAFAALPAPAAAAFNSLSADLQELIIDLWPTVAAVVVAFTLFNLFKIVIYKTLG